MRGKGRSDAPGGGGRGGGRKKFILRLHGSLAKQFAANYLQDKLFENVRAFNARRGIIDPRRAGKYKIKDKYEMKSKQFVCIAR